MDAFWISLPIIATLFMGAVSPGPSFIVVAQASMSGSRAKGLGIAIGLALASMVFGAFALLGLDLVFTAVPWLFWAMKLAGGLYLIYLAYRIFKGANEKLDVSTQKTQQASKDLWGRNIALGFMTQMSNPKTAIVFASVFATFLPRDPDGAIYAVLLPSILLMEFGWYAFVATILSQDKPRAVYSRAKTLIDRMAGGILGLLGVKLLHDSV